MITPSTPELQAARDLILTYGWNSTCYQLLAPGISYWFDTEGVVGFVEQAGTCVVAGEPICAEERLLPCWEALAEEIARAGLRLCMVGAEEPFASQFLDVEGYSVVKIGAQPMWNPAHWDELVDEHSSIRSQVNRARNKDVGVDEWDKPPRRWSPCSAVGRRGLPDSRSPRCTSSPSPSCSTSCSTAASSSPYTRGKWWASSCSPRSPSGGDG